MFLQKKILNENSNFDTPFKTKKYIELAVKYLNENLQKAA